MCDLPCEHGQFIRGYTFDGKHLFLFHKLTIASSSTVMGGNSCSASLSKMSLVCLELARVSCMLAYITALNSPVHLLYCVLKILFPCSIDHLWFYYSLYPTLLQWSLSLERRMCRCIYFTQDLPFSSLLFSVPPPVMDLWVNKHLLQTEPSQMRVKTDTLIYGHNNKSLRVGLCPFISKIVIDSLLHPITCLVRGLIIC